MAHVSRIFFGGYYGTHHRRRLYPPFGVDYFLLGILILPGSTTKNATHMKFSINKGSLLLGLLE